MKALSKIVLAVLIGGLVAFGVGCGQDALPSGMSPEAVIKQALLNQKDITKAVFEFNVNADLKGDVDGVKNELKGWAKVTGTSNTDDMENQFAFSVDGKSNGESAKADLEVRGNKDGLFVKIGNVTISDEEAQSMIDMFTADYKGKWTLLSFATASDSDIKGYAMIEYNEGDPLFLKDIEYKGTRDVLGVKSYVFSGKLDKEVFADTMSSEQAAQLEMFLEKGEITGELYTAVNEKVWTGMTLNVKMSETEMNGTASLVFLMNPTKANKVETPKHEAEITGDDMAAWFGGAVEPTATDDTYSDYDTTGYPLEDGTLPEDFETMDLEGWEEVPVDEVPVQ